MTDIQVCKVCIPNTYGYLYDYKIDGAIPALGSRVLVSFRNQEKTGFVWAYGDALQLKKPLKNLLVIENKIIFDAHLREFCQWLADYYHTPLSEILSLACPRFLKDIKRPLVLEKQHEYILTENYIEILDALPLRLKKIRTLIAFMQEHQKVNLIHLKTAGFTKSLIKKSLELGLCKTQECENHSPFISQNLQLNEEQLKAYQAIQLDAFKVYLLQGVTGSGKTEVYIELMRDVISKNQQVLMLIPEIGLTRALYQRLESRLGVECVLFHSSLTDKQRYENWLKAFEGQASLILGTRSAIFANLPQLGLIVIDEEHDGSFKQLEGIRYSAKDAAIMRAKIANIPIVLGTATPSLETYQNALTHKYQHLYLTNKALNQFPLHYQVIDLRAQEIRHGLARTSLLVIKKHLDQGEQVLVFINRRGYAPLIFCHECGWSKQCQHCDANMTWHRKRQCLMCHHCGLQAQVPQHCESCFHPNLSPMGVGTEQLVEFLTEEFSAFKVLRFDRDVVRNKDQLETALAEIETQKVQLIVGTQMLTKGHHFPQLGLVVIVDGDSAFYQADFRALERLGQVFTQVSGRAGRADIPGEVLIQTHLPQHPLLLTLLQQGYISFMEVLLSQRQEASLPPFTHLGLIRAQGKDNLGLQQFLKILASKNCFNQHIKVLGPAPAPMEKKAGIFRWQLILKAPQRSSLHSELKKLLPIIEKYTPKGVRCFIEIDPYDWSA